MSEFSDAPFVAGSLTGMRAFRVDKYGRLTGVTHAQVFRPGENVAVCRKAEHEAMQASWRGLSVSLWAPSFLVSDQPPTPPAAKPLTAEAVETPTTRHRVGSVDCGCGYYAYFNGGNDYKKQDRTIGALVEGYGVCSVGERGFRAEKARLLALFKPKRDIRTDIVERIWHNYPNVPVFPNRAAAVAEFPLTLPTYPTPESHADFWDLP